MVQTKINSSSVQDTYYFSSYSSYFRYLFQLYINLFQLIWFLFQCLFLLIYSKFFYSIVSCIISVNFIFTVYTKKEAKKCYRFQSQAAKKLANDMQYCSWSAKILLFTSSFRHWLFRNPRIPSSWWNNRSQFNQGLRNWSRKLY